MDISLRRGVALLLLSSAWLAAQTSADPMELSRQAGKLTHEGKQDEALALYNQALRRSPNLVEANTGAGIALDLKGDYAEARQHLLKALARVRSDMRVPVLRAIAVSYAFDRNCKEALKYDRQIFDPQMTIKNYIGAAETADEVARICLESGDLDDAFEWYRTGHETALKKPTLTDAERDLWNFRWEHAQARIAARREKQDEARQHMAAAKAVLDKSRIPDQARFYPYLAGYVAFYGGDAKEAIQQLQKADMSDPFILCLLAQAYEKSGEKTQALEYYRKVLNSNMHNTTNAFARPLAKKKVAQG